MDTWSMIDAERTEFADLCETLTAEQWDTQSLCTNWRVRDVVGHVSGGANLTMGKAMVELVRHGFRLGPMLERTAIKAGSEPTDQLASAMRATVGARKTPPGVKPEGVLTDAIVHQQDVRRAIGVPRVVASDRLTVALDSIKDVTNSLLPGKQRVAELSLRATDMDWSAGSAGAPEVTGPGEALLLAMCGRPVALGDLSGAGVLTLRTRIA
ncbi:MAG: maleylpyruvate isomerase family mycothiol-dependent enzyme [Acidimicrobiia bacterium]